ncbi:MAG: hypothetical protein BGO87_12770 [Flavobacteriia bacterium 40-80]|nr:MAG: hypothetical protein BGO87_12770 [Flavobacteriia bacterium 40-80]
MNIDMDWTLLGYSEFDSDRINKELEHLSIVTRFTVDELTEALKNIYHVCNTACDSLSKLAEVINEFEKSKKSEITILTDTVKQYGISLQKRKWKPINQ